MDKDRNIEPLVSVIMPVFNGANTIGLALASLIHQAYEYWECIVVNDGSTDNTVNIIHSFNDKRIKLIDLGKNYGRGYARDVALKNCTGKYLSYLDADDILHHDKLAKQVEVLETYPEIDLVGCNRVQFLDNLEPILESAPNHIEKKQYQDGDPLLLILPSVMIRRERASRFNYDKRLNVGEDIDYLSRYLSGSFYANISANLYYYRLGNLTRKKLIYYSKEDVRRGFVLFERNKKIGLRIIVTQSIKCIIYFVVSLFTGADFFLRKRGLPITEVEKNKYFGEIQRLLSF